MSREQKARTVKHWRVCEPPKEGSFYYSILARCYQEKNCHLASVAQWLCISHGSTPSQAHVWILESIPRRGLAVMILTHY